MKNKLLYFFLAIVPLFVSAQDGDLNMELLANVPVPEGGSGIWHYVDKNGIEYAVFGSKTAVIIYSLEDPKKPIERFRLPGVQTIWREVYIYGDYIYGVNDQSANGLIIINMKGAPNNITGKFWKSTITANGNTAELNTCHTVFVDDKGRLYLNGCSPWRGTLIFDISQTPEDPKFLGAQTKRYCHDNFGRNDTIWSSDILDGVLSFWDISNPANPKEIGVVQTPFAFTHNAWPSDDGKYVFATDERENAYVASYDASDLSNIRLLDTWRPKDTEGKGVIPHNTRYINGFLVTAYYTDGIKINDVHRPENIVEVGSFDTWSGPHGGFNGCWGVSPFLPSGIIVASDIQAGLFVIKPNYIRACYLEGKVTDSITGLAIRDVNVVIKTSRQNGKTTDSRGNYKTGYATAGIYDVEFNHPDYFPKTISVTLINGEVNVKDVVLKPRNLLITQKIIVKDAKTLNAIEGASILLTNSNRKVSQVTGPNGEAVMSFYQDNILFDLYTGTWGYLHKKLVYDSENPQPEITVLLDKGYQDDFIFDQGWSVKGTATAGQWVRGVPIATDFRGITINPGADVSNDYGTECYVTGNKGGAAGDDDVDNGNVLLTSPIFDLSKYNRPLLSYSTWFVNTGGDNNPNDKMTVRITNGKVSVLLKEVDMTQNGWVKSDSIDLKNLLELTDSMFLVVETADDNPGHLVEAGFDAFLISESLPSKIHDLTNEWVLTAQPSIFTGSTRIQYQTEGTSSDLNIRIIGMEGKTVFFASGLSETGVIEVGQNLQPGTYQVILADSLGRSSALRIVKL